MPSLIWLVDDDAAFSSLAHEVAARVGVSLVLMSREAALNCTAGPLPNRVIVDGELFRESRSRGVTSMSALPRYVECAERVLVCTGYLDEDLDAERMGDPRIGLLRKPFDLQDFEAALAWLGGREASPAAAQRTSPRPEPFSLRTRWGASRTDASATAE